MKWVCACGVENSDNRDKCAGCGCTRKQNEEYKKNVAPSAKESGNVIDSIESSNSAKISTGNASFPCLISGAPLTEGERVLSFAKSSIHSSKVRSATLSIEDRSFVLKTQIETAFTTKAPVIATVATIPFADILNIQYHKVSAGIQWLSAIKRTFYCAVVFTIAIIVISALRDRNIDFHNVYVPDFALLILFISLLYGFLPGVLDIRRDLTAVQIISSDNKVLTIFVEAKDKDRSTAVLSMRSSEFVEVSQQNVNSSISAEQGTTKIELVTLASTKTGTDTQGQAQDNFMLLALICILLPLVGFIIGGYRIKKGMKRPGLMFIFGSVWGAIIWAFLIILKQ